MTTAQEIESLSKETEDKILDSATKIFVLKGRAGASMQDIAQEAGINRTLLNYYFRSKDKLFEQVFNRIFSKFWPAIDGFMKDDLPIVNRIERFIDFYFTILIENPFIPVFIMQEVSVNPLSMKNAMLKGGFNPADIIKIFENEINKGNLPQIDGREIVVNLISLIVFPFAARRLIEEIIFMGDSLAYSEFLNQRKEKLKKLFIKTLIP
jgi:AcrR family transcriptional regulator